MHVMINGADTILDKGISLIALLEKHTIEPLTVVIEYNGAIVDRKVWDTTIVQENDTIELIRIVGGG